MNPERWQRIEQLYHAALERDADQRAAFLAAACEADTALRGEVEVLLAANEQASGFLATPALELEAKQLAAEMPAPLGVQVGQALSHYKIISRIGAGGMGEVFLAQDKILERRVALKLLPVQFTQDAERLQRFIREAKAASALNHPNIITIYEIGEVATALGQTHFIATEFIEGETLRTWTVDEEKRLRQSVDIAMQVAAALDAAHKAGIVHRDIKPENVMLRPDGLVKVLDFGLAKLIARPVNSVDHEARTLVEGVKTLPGMILGTLRYMSPEQARGRSLDARSDIFSLGVVFYELLTAQPLFAGDTDADVIAGIIHKQAPPLAQYLPEVSPELERIVQKALAKDAEQRYQDARDLQIDLQTLKQESELSARLARSGSLTTDKRAAQTTSALTAPRFSLRHLLMGLPVVLLLIGAIWWLAARRTGRVEAPPPTVEIVSWRSAPGEVHSIGSFSPDAKRIAYTSTEGGIKSIWVKSTLSGNPKQITTDEFKNDNPIWSPDGEYVAYFSLRGDHPGIWKTSYFGGSLTEITQVDDGSVQLRSWSKSDKLYYELKQNLFAFDLNARQTNQVTSFDSSTQNIFAITISPDEEHIAYASQDEKGNGSLWFMPARDGVAVQVVSEAPEIRNVVWHADGKRILYSAGVDGTYQIFVAYTDGRKPAQITFGDRDAFALDVAADGTKILYGSSKEDSEVWGVQVAQAEEFNLTSGINCELWPDASPDGKTVAFQSIKNLSQGNKLQSGAILIKPADSAGQSVELVSNGFLPRWSPDGKQLAFMRSAGRTANLYTVKATGGEETQLTTGGVASVENTVLPYNRYQTSYYGWSPDSSKVVYCSERSGRRDLWMVFADGGNDTQITNNRDANLYLYCPLWSVDGKRLAYTSTVYKVGSDGKPTFKVWVIDTATKESTMVFQSATLLRLLGWSQDETGLILAMLKGKVGGGFVTDVGLIQVPVITGEPRAIATLQTAYFYNDYLSADRRMIAFASHQDGKDNIWVIPTTGGAAKKLTANNDPKLYFSSLAWSPDSKAIYFGKQSRYSLLSMITNFK